MAKRSPILGYNHNVRYRGLIFHVQTEDSGLLSPHLFTHLFYEGVIISTRKLVYDAGADEGAIKSLMQAQHKAVMKDLKRGVFDDKMDTNLAGIPGLLPRGTKETAESLPLRDSEPAIPAPEELRTEPGIEIIPAADELPPPPPTRASAPVIIPPPIRAGTEPLELDANATQPIDVYEELALPVVARTVTPPPIPTAARAKTPAPIMIQPRNAPRAESEPAPKKQPTLPPPPSEDLDPPTINEDPATLAAQMFASSSSARPFTHESAPEIEIVPEEPPRRRATRDTDIETPPSESDGVPAQVGMTGTGSTGSTTRTGSRPDMPVPPLPAQRAPFSAAALPPSRPVTRPPSRQQLQPISPPSVVSRPVDPGQPRQQRDSDSIEVYAPAPTDPPGVERPGQYAQHKRNSKQFEVPTPQPRERSSSSPIPSGLGRPLRPSEQKNALPRPVPREPSTPQPSSTGIPQPVAPASTLPRAKPASPIPRTGSGSTPQLGRERPPTPGRTPTPARIQSTQPIMRSNTGSGGVVMTRPAVIVGAPAKPTTQRVRKAREEEGRGFGQGLISEKSLDEVILAYLSEDGDDKT